MPASVLVVGVAIRLGGGGLGRTLCSGDGDGTLHPGVVVPGLQAGEVDLVGLGELPDDLTGLARCDGDLVGVRVLHLRELLHELVVLLQLGLSAQHELVLDPTGVLDHEADRFALLDVQAGRREAHVVGHVNVDRARDLGGFAGHADGVAVAVAVSVAVGSFGGGRGSGMVYAVMGLAGEGGERDKRGCDGDERLFHGNSLLN
mmetsp:Transcript_53125/g.124250  ORF Transcript_53125/g.124250 Transcript_53125/m.124250 type:complete len:203 (+) Transcript_53125:242-850(+)